MNYSAVDSKGIYFDFKLDNLFNKKNGFFVELGAFNGIDYSNTAFLEFNRNWTGILIEPSFNCYKQCITNRPSSICVNAACVSHDYKLTTINGDFNDITMASIDGIRLNNTENLVSVPALTLDYIFDNNNVKTIDLLSLDAEGYEFEILKGMNLNKYRPRYMLIEIYRNEYDNITSYLNQYNYKMIENFSNFNYIDNPSWDGTHQDFLFMDTISC